ncbi:MAG: isopentenyl-diphosphate Delta-isomerase [Bacteroidales bacterium]|nr:isopentenyl-diphosphate Delta-isomerase [Bacteroidales bacterium]
MEKVILVDKKDNEIGTVDKMEAHVQGLLHRAVSVLIFNTKGEMLLQQRAFDKYHSGGLWTNATCTHPRKNESNIDAAKRRLVEEMGISAELEEKFIFKYKAFLDNDLIEHELDHVFFGVTDKFPVLNSEEAVNFKYISYLELITDIEQNPDLYTVWFKIIMKEGEKEIFKMNNKLSM